MERKIILITGIDGFAASHLAKYLMEEGHEVHGTIRIITDRFKLKDIIDKITVHLVELTDSFSIDSVISKVKPDEIYHLAAQSYVKASWDSPVETYSTNVIGTVNLFEACRKLEKQPAILVTSTSEVYGAKDGSMNEDTRPEPNTHYGISKYAQDMIARLYHRAYGMKVMVSRSFNITGYGRGDVFVDSNFAKQVVEIEKGVRESIKHGNLESARDFTDIGDVIKGYVKILRSERWGEVFCLASGEPVKIQTVLDTLIELSGKDIKTELDPERMRPVDTPTMKGDATKSKEVLGWTREIPLKESLNNLLVYWRERL
jgi:GDP-4-dehydro-6-deoxy-D-mannose reductase